MKRIIIATFTSLALATPVLAKPLAPPVFESPTPSTGLSFAQLGSTQAYVPMKHMINDKTNYHALATKSGNLKMKVKIGMKCPTGHTVSYLAYRRQTSSNGTKTNIVVWSQNAPNTQNYTQNLEIEPFSLNELNQIGYEAFGGTWKSPDSHPNTQKKIKKTIKKSIEVIGACSGLALQTKSFPVTLTITFEDKG